MRTQLIFETSILTGAVTVVALLLHPFAFGAAFWPPSLLCPLPSEGQFPFYAFVAIIEAGALGLGLSWFAWGYQFVLFFRARWQRIAVYLSVGWLLANWYSHDALHINIGPDLQRMIAIELGFHVTLIAAAALVALAIMCQSRTTL